MCSGALVRQQSGAPVAPLLIQYYDTTRICLPAQRKKKEKKNRKKIIIRLCHLQISLEQISPMQRGWLLWLQRGRRSQHTHAQHPSEITNQPWKKMKEKGVWKPYEPF